MNTDLMKCPLVWYPVILGIFHMNKTPVIVALLNLSLVSSFHDTFCEIEEEEVGDSLVKIMKNLKYDNWLVPPGKGEGALTDICYTRMCPSPHRILVFRA